MKNAFYIAGKMKATGSSSFTRVIINLGVIAVAVSLCVLLLTSAFIAGFQKEITQKVFNFWGHIHITHVDSDRSIDAIPFDKSLPEIKEIINLSQIEYMPRPNEVKLTKGGIEKMYPFIHSPGILSTKTGFDGVICKGIDASYDWERLQTYMLEGEMFSFENEEFHHQCILSKIQADRLEVAVGDPMLLSFIIDGKQIKKRVHVKGIYDTGLEEYDRKFVLVDLKLLQNVFDWGENLVSGFSILLDDLDDINPINEYLYIEQLPPELYSESIRLKFPGIFEWLDLQKVNEQVLLMIMLIVAFINLSTVLIILILDRAKMVAILKTLGAKTKLIMQVFVIFMGHIMVRGFLYGNLLAFTIGWLQHRFHFITLNQTDYYLAYAPVDVDIPKIILINFLAFIVILIFMILPALVISKIKPVKTLRFN